MSERKFPSLHEANNVAALIKKTAGHNVAVMQTGDHWVVRPITGPMSMVEVTQELLRQLGK